MLRAFSIAKGVRRPATSTRYPLHMHEIQPIAIKPTMNSTHHGILYIAGYNQID